MAEPGSENEITAEIMADIAKAKELWKAVGATEVPTTLKEARAKRWELASDAFEVSALMAYPAGSQEADSKRAIRLETAIAIVDAFELSMIQELVIRPDNIIAQLRDGIAGFFQGAFNAIAFIWKHWDKRKTIWAIFKALMQNVWLAAGVGIVTAAAIGVAKSRRSIESEMRKKALPQRKGTRYVRRKVSRR